MEITLSLLSFFLLIIIIFGTLFACFFAVEHANEMAIHERPFDEWTKNTLKKQAKIVLMCGAIVTVCLILRLYIRGQSLQQMLTSAGIYKIFIVPGVWIISYITPSKRKKKVKERSKMRKVST